MTSPVLPASEPAITKRRISYSRLLLIMLVLLGFALRIHDLDGQSMWSDEGLSLVRAQQPLSEVFKNVITVDGIDTHDTNPPFYFLLLHIQRSLAGDTVFAMRFLGVAAATLAVPLMFVLGSVALGQHVGLITALLMAISPFHIWQSQVLRNYGLLLTLCLISVYGLFRFILAKSDKRQSRWLIVWAVAGLLGIYTHYFGFFIFAYGLIALVLVIIRQWGVRRLLGDRRVWFGLGLALLVTLPALALAINRFGAGQQIDFNRLPLATILKHAASAFAVGIQRDLTHSWWLYLPAVLISIGGVYFGWRNKPLSAGLLLGYQLVPLGLLLAFSLINPLYNGARHLLIGLPPFLIFLASGIVGPLQLLHESNSGGRFHRYWRWVALALGTLVIFIQLAWLNSQFTSPDLVRDDIRGVAEYLSEQATDEDIIVLHDTLINFTFDYYYDGAAPVVAIPRFDESSTDSAIMKLVAVAQNKRRVWFLSEPAPRTGFDRQALTKWADRNWPRFFNEAYPFLWLRVNLMGYALQDRVQSTPDSALPADISWDETLNLHGYNIPIEITSGDPWWMSFYLSQPGPPGAQHSFSLRLVDDQGRTWAQLDKPIPWGYPPAAAQSDTFMRYDHNVIVPPGVPPGQYQLLLRLVKTLDGSEVPDSEGQVDFKLADISVAAAPCVGDQNDMPAEIYRSDKFGQEIELRGHTLPAETVRPGHLLSLDVWWCVLKQPTENYRLRLQIVGEDGQVVGESIGPLSRPDYPPTQWESGQLIMGKAEIVVPADIKEGPYRLQLSLLPPESDQALRVNWALGRRSVPLGSIQVESWPLVTEVPPVAEAKNADFGQPPLIELLGYDLTLEGSPDDDASPIVQFNAGDTLNLSLIWRSLVDDIPSSYTVFVHLANEAEEIGAQGDGIPVGGFRPTTSWRAGEVIQDTHLIPVPLDLPAGTYWLWIGFFDHETGQRLPVTVNDQQMPDGRLLLQTVRVE